MSTDRKLVCLFNYHVCNILQKFTEDENQRWVQAIVSYEPLENVFTQLRFDAVRV